VDAATQALLRCALAPPTEAILAYEERVSISPY
jgi:hypothetical protein